MSTARYDSVAPAGAEKPIVIAAQSHGCCRGPHSIGPDGPEIAQQVLGKLRKQSAPRRVAEGTGPWQQAA